MDGEDFQNGPSEHEGRRACPKVEPINNNLNSLTYHERLNLIENEVQNLYSFCIERGFTDEQIQKCVSAMRDSNKSVVRKIFNDTRNHFLLVFFLGCVIAAALSHPPTWAVICATSKILFMKTLPYWDWASLYTEQCAITNVWMENEKPDISNETCSYCRVTEVQKVSELSHSQTVDMLKNQTPFVVQDAVQRMNVKTLRIDELVDLYLNHPLLSSPQLEGCAHRNTINTTEEAGSLYDFFHAYKNNKSNNNTNNNNHNNNENNDYDEYNSFPAVWHAAWRNCNGGKIIRRYHARPYFFPPMMQLETENTVIMAHGMDGDETFTLLKDTTTKDTGVVVSVLSGALGFTLRGREECVVDFACEQEIKVEVQVGETLFFDEDFWTSAYIPLDEGETVAVANYVGWD